MDITVGDDYLGLCNKEVHISMCPILKVYGVMVAWNSEHRVSITENKRNKITNKHRYL